MNAGNTVTRERFLALDGLRGIAAFGVVLFHVYPKYTFWFWSFVDLFFVLSGFLITRIVITSPLPVGLMLKRFWMRRVLRIWPVYYAALLVCIAYGLAKTLKLDADYTMHSVWQSFFFLQFIEFHFIDYVRDWDYIPYFRHSWSVAVEEQFYVIWPLLLLLLKNQYRWLLPLGLLMMAGSMLLRGNGVFDLALGTRPDGLVLGSLIAIAYQHPQHRWWRYLLIPLLAWATLVVVSYGYDGYFVFSDYPAFDIDTLSSTVTVPAFSIIYAALIAYCVSALPRQDFTLSQRAGAGLFRLHQLRAVYFSCPGDRILQRHRTTRLWRPSHLVDGCHGFATLDRRCTSIQDHA